MRIPEPLKILEHVDAITRHRDSALLDRSIVFSLMELLKAPRIRLHEIVRRKGGMLTAVSAWNEGAAVEYLNDLSGDDDFQPVEHFPLLMRALREQAPVAESEDTRHGYWLPIFIKDHPVACFEIESVSPLTPHQVEMAHGMLALYRNYLSLLEDSQQDTLTGLANRKTFERTLTRLLGSINASSSRASRNGERRIPSGRDHWLAVMDIDHFKRVNDQFGHLFGDEVLILFANLMRNAFRQQDRMFRFGGEEFVVLLRNVTQEGALKSLERFRQAVASHEFPGRIGHVTVSIGFARIHQMDTPAAVLGQADDALYHAKEHGRDQVHCHETLVAAGVLKQKNFNSEMEMF